MDLEPAAQALKVRLDALPGAAFDVRSPPRGAPNIAIYKVMGKMFAILQFRGTLNVILKCNPHLIEVLKDQYSGIGRRSHLDPRFWMSVRLDADVPPAEIVRLAEASYALVREGLTKKQQAELAALADAE
jgi:predicted DNA-binding protein (MmcQ/YjbR family)